MKPIDIKPKDLEIVKKILAEHVSEFHVCAFGSRVQWTAKDSSDLDLVVMTEKPLPSAKMTDLKEAFTESDLPFKVDVVDWATTKEGFRKIIDKQAVNFWPEQILFSEIRLGDVCDKIGSGATPRGGNSVYLDIGTISLIRSQNIYNDGFHKDGLAYITQKHADELKNVEVKKGDLLLNITGDSVARCCQVDPDVLPARVNQHVAIIRPDGKTLDNKYLRYYMISPTTQDNLLSMAGAGATRPALTKSMIENLKISAPDLQTQSAIAFILGTLDDKIDLNRRMNNTLEEIARAIYKSWFVDFDPVKKKAAGLPTGLPEDVEKLFPKEFERSELGEMPTGWKVQSISDLAEKIGMGPFGSSIKVSTFIEAGIPVISGQHLKETLLDDNTYNFISIEQAEKLRNSNVYQGDIIFTHAGNIGQVAYIPTTSQYNRYILSQRQFYLRCKQDIITPIFLVYYFKSSVGQHCLLSNSTTTGVPSISQPVTNLKTIKFGLPNKLCIQAFSNQINKIHLMIGFNKKQIYKLTELRELLIPRLLSGSMPIHDAEKLLKEANV